MKTITLNINDLDVSSAPVEFVCFGLGSCIGLFLFDRVKYIAGGAHIALPAHVASNGWADAQEIFQTLLNRFIEKGSNLKTLHAKMVGGANVLNSSLDVGSQNSTEVYNLLVRNKIYIAAADVGGSEARTARYNSNTGSVQINSSGKVYCI